MRAMSLYDLSLFVHIAAVVIGFGSTFALALAFPVATTLDAKHLPYVHALSDAINRRFATPALVVILITGIYQTIDGDWGFGSAWISATFLIVIVLGGLIGGYFLPTDRKLGAMVTRELAEGSEPSAEYGRRARTLGAVGGLAGVLVLVAIFLMVVKPGA
jgi:uncharacterized membrane protein